MKKVLTILLIVLLSGCANSRYIDSYAGYYAKRDMDFNKDLNTCWQVLLDVLSDENQPIATIEKESGIIVTDFVLIDKSSLMRYASVPYNPRGTGYTQGKYKLNIRVKKTSEGVTNIKVNIYLEGFWNESQRSGWENAWHPVASGAHPLESRGVLENEILQSVNSMLSR